MAKLTDIRIHACTGDENPALQYKGERSYFPHIHIGEANLCTNPRYYRSSYGQLESHRGSQLTINEAGAHNHDGQVPFDALAQLFASAPRLLALLDRVTDSKYWDDRTAAILEARRLVDRLLALDIPDPDEDGWGPYYNQDGTPWTEIKTDGKQ